VSPARRAAASGLSLHDGTGSIPRTGTGSMWSRAIDIMLVLRGQPPEVLR
jgi:hypothetical protein